MKIKANIIIEVDAQHYPLDTIAELLYATIDDLQNRQQKFNENLPFPMTITKQIKDAADTGKLTCNVAREQ